MAKDSIPEVLPTSPLSLGSPHCGAGPKKDCQKTRGGFAKVHLARIQAAAAVDMRNANSKMIRTKPLHKDVRSFRFRGGTTRTEMGAIWSNL